jgi:uncharacterized protein YpuA (DUF1002 family)
MEVINRSQEWENAFEDDKTRKAILFLMIKEHVKKIPNDQELGKEIRKIIINHEENNNSFKSF